MMTETQETWFWILLLPVFIFIRVISVKWIEPFMQKHNKPSWVDRQLRSNTVKGELVSIAFGAIVIVGVWYMHNLFSYVYNIFGETYYYAPQKIAWGRVILTPVGVFIITVSLARIYHLKKRKRNP